MCKVIYDLVGTENGNPIKEAFLDKEKLEMWVNYRKSISSSFEYEVSERTPKSIFDCLCTYEAKWFPTGVVINGYTELAPGIKCGLSYRTWIPNPNPSHNEVIYREIKTLK